MIDQRRLEVLLAFANHGTMAAAAQALFLSPSAISQQMQALEREVGTSLVERRGRRLVLTTAGDTLARFASEIGAISESALATMRAFSGTYRGAVHLSAFPSFAGAILPESIARLREAFPELDVLVSDLEPYESVRALREGAVDLAVIDDLNPADLTGLDVVDIGSDELVLCATESSTFGIDPVALRCLKDERWLLDGSQEVFDVYLHRLCQESGFTPRIVARCRNVSVTLALVEAGAGVALLSRMHTRRDAFRVQVRSLAPARFRTIRVARRRSSRPSHLIDAVLEVVRSTSQEHLADATRS